MLPLAILILLTASPAPARDPNSAPAIAAPASPGPGRTARDTVSFRSLLGPASSSFT